MLKLSSMSRDAIKAMVYLARQGKGRPIATHVIADVNGLPEGFLHKAINRLADAELLRTAAGPKGGCWLARPAKEISLADVVEAIEGPIRGELPIVLEREADDTEKQLQAILDQAADLVRREWGNITVADLMRK